MRSFQSLTVLGVVAVGLVVSARLTLQADDGPSAGRARRETDRRVTSEESIRGQGPAVSVQDALQRPCDLPFREPTSLSEVCRHLRRALNAPVVLDLAALKRLEIGPEERVQLELQGVRLKTGLKLLLDQAGLTYRVVPEDNLLIVTDPQGSDDPVERVMSELKSLHRDVHDLQDAVDDLRAAMGVEEEGGPKMRKPTIIEELPGEGGGKSSAPPSSSPARPRS
jgi:hypothetical protein